jgi:hypothetical protein
MKVIDGPRRNCSRQGGVAVQHGDSLWRLLCSSFRYFDKGLQEKAAETRTDGRQHGKRHECYEWPRRGWNSDETRTWRSGSQGRKQASKKRASSRSE